MTPDLAIKGGTVVSGSSRALGHVYVSDERITEVSNREIRARREIDASGLIVLPGMVDTHVHLMDPGDTDREDFPTGTAAAAAAGVTTIVEHTHSRPVRTVDDLVSKIEHVEGRSNVDFGLAAHVWPDAIDGLERLWRGGVVFFKIFTCTTHGVPGLVGNDLERALTTVGGFGGAVLAHCEDEDVTARAEARLREAGRRDNALLIEWRSREAEIMAVEQVCRLAGSTGAHVNIAHVSSPEVLALITATRYAGHTVGAEACPQYFALREGEVEVEGPFRKFAPPARARSDGDEDAMWDLVRSGAFTHFSTDHAPSTKAQKQAGIWDAPFGLPGLDTTAPFLIDAALRGRIDLTDVVRLYSESPAKRYGLHPRKGSITPGADADIVLVDPSGRWTVADADVISKASWTPYAGRAFHGRVVRSLLRGNEIAADRVAADRRSGRFLAGPGA